MNTTTDRSSSIRETASPTSSPSRRVGDTTLGTCRHVCAFFRTLDEHYRVLLPFIEEGFAKRERAFHIVNPVLRDDHRRRLTAAGIDVPDAENRGQLIVRDWRDTYRREGRFDQQLMLATLEGALKDSIQSGFPMSRLICNMEWAAEDGPAVDDLLEYETRFNTVLADYPDPVICTYDLSKFRADFVVDVMRTHPMIIIGGILQPNPFFVPPDELLRELRSRQSPHPSAPPFAS
jgi:hypothetical protein